MFGFSNKKRFEICDKIGIKIHKQISEALTENSAALSEPEDAIFFHGYLNGFMIGFTSIHDSSNSWAVDVKYKKHICEGVIPGRLWDIFERAQAIAQLSDQAGFDVEELWDLGKKSGWYDSQRQLVGGDNLFRYLTGEEIDLAFYDDYVKTS